MRVVLLNALPLNAVKYDNFVITVSRVTVDHMRRYLKNLRDYVQYELKCYIRHSATVDLLNKLLNIDLGTSNELYQYQDGDIIFVVTLKKPTRGAEVINLSEEDIEIFRVNIAKGE